jgi:putative phosphoribosyl transferase
VSTRFATRTEAGRLLGARLVETYRATNPVVLGLPRAACPWSRRWQALDAPVDVFVVRKLGVPSQPELAFGAVSSGGVRCSTPASWRLPGWTRRRSRG